MIHEWSDSIHVRTRVVAIVDENGEFVNYYMCLNPVASLQMYPAAILSKNARGYINTILLGRENLQLDVGGK